MAVQAQYPSNLFLHNRTLQQETNQIGKDYSLQPKPVEGGGGGGGTAIDSRFLDHQFPNHIFFNKFPVGSCVNPRKRGREVAMNQLMSPGYQQQSCSNQLIDLTQLHSRTAGVNTGLRLAFSDQQQQRQHQHSVSPRSCICPSLMSEDLSTQISQERDEIKHFLQVQGQELRRTVAEKRHRHYCALLESASKAVARRLKDKDAEAEKAVRRKAELEARAAQLSMEAQVWQARAAAQEAEAAVLQARLQQAIVSGGGGCYVSRGEEAGLGCAAGDTEDAESAYVDPERVVAASRPGCKACGKRVASVVLLPCRHLCICIECDGVVLACPLCLSLRSSSIEVYMS